MSRTTFLLIALALSLSAGVAAARAGDKILVAAGGGSIEAAALKAAATACTDGSFNVACGVDGAVASTDTTADKPKRHALVAEASPVPEPSSLMLMAAGIAAVGFIGLRRLSSR